MFSSRLPLQALIALCRAMRHGLHAGLSPVKVLKQQAKSGHPKLRPVAGEMAESLRRGNSLADTLNAQGTKFPIIFRELAIVGEKAGRQPEVFEELERYFESQQDSRRAFVQATVWPIMSYCAAVTVMALLALILQLIAGDSKGGFDPIGTNKMGILGPILILVVGFGFLGGLIFFYLVARDNDEIKSKLEAFGLRIPGLAAPYRNFALYRFAITLSMTHEAGMRADEALYSSLQASANLAYQKHAIPTSAVVRGGKKIRTALKMLDKSLFPVEFLDSVAVGEESGQVSEVMGRVADNYRENAIQQTKRLAQIAGGVVYAMVALMIIVFIIRIVISIGGVYEDAMKGT
jgi:type IV pilus assembly protein PilC